MATYTIGYKMTVEFEGEAEIEAGSEQEATKLFEQYVDESDENKDTLRGGAKVMAEAIGSTYVEVQG